MQSRFDPIVGEFTTGRHEETPRPYLDPLALCYDAVSTYGPVTFAEVRERVCGLAEVRDGILHVIEADDIGWGCIDLLNAERIISPTMTSGILEYDDILDIPETSVTLDIDTIRSIELFAGIGAFRKALTNLGIPHTAVISEIDKYAAASYNAIHGETPNLGYITKIDRLPECDRCGYSGVVNVVQEILRKLYVPEVIE